MLTPEEKQIVEFGKKNKKTPQEVLVAIDKYRASIKPKPEKPQSFMQDLGGDLKQVGTDIKNTILRRGDKQREIMTADQSPLSTGFQTATNLATAVTDVAGNVIKGGVKAVLPQKAENKIKETITKVGQKVLSLPETKQFIENYENLKKEDPEYARNVVALAEGGEFLLNLVGLKLAKTGVEATGRGIKTGLEVTTDLAKQGTERVVEVGSNVVSKTDDIVNATGIKRIPNKIKSNFADKVETEEAIKALPSKTAQDAVREGVDIGDVETIIRNTINKNNKPLMKDLYKTIKNFARNKSGTKPTEIIGKPIVAGIKKLKELRKTVGSELGQIADTMGKVTKEELTPEVIKSLQSVPGLEGVKTTMLGVLDFSNTVLATKLTKADRQAIREIFMEATKPSTAKRKHLLRQELFETLGGKKKGGLVLTDTQEKAYEAIRKALSNVLDTKNPKYKEVNLKYAKIMDPLMELQKRLKAQNLDVDLLQEEAGIIARRLTSFAPSGPEIEQILRNMDAVLKTKVSVEELTRALQDLNNILGRYYDIAGGTSFQGEIKNATAGISEAVISTAKKLAGETPAVRRKAIEKLLNELLGTKG